jgi:hypothetical protein
MTASLFSGATRRPHSPSTQDDPDAGNGSADSADGSCGTAPTKLDDAQREVEILHAGREIEEAMAEVSTINNRNPHVFSDFADAASARARADRARLRMEALIRGRSAESVLRMEQERGLR